MINKLTKIGFAKKQKYKELFASEKLDIEKAVYIAGHEKLKEPWFKHLIEQGADMDDLAELLIYCSSHSKQSIYLLNFLFSSSCF